QASAHLAECAPCRAIVAEAAKVYFQEGAPTAADAVARAVTAAETNLAPPGLRSVRGQAAALALEPGSRIGRFIVGRPIGEGGMGVVFEADDPQLGRKVALKLLRPDSSSVETREASRARLLREAQAMAKVSHPNVVAVHDAGTLDQQVFVVMELVRGGN